MDLKEGIALPRNKDKKFMEPRLGVFIGFMPLPFVALRLVASLVLCTYGVYHAN
jgi:hypothetical protein